MAPKSSSVAQAGSEPKKQAAQRTSTRTTRSVSKIPTAASSTAPTAGTARSTLPTPANTRPSTARARQGTSRLGKRTILESQEDDASAEVGETVPQPAKKTRTTRSGSTAPKAPSRVKKAATGARKTTIKTSGAEESEVEEVPPPTAKAAASKRGRTAAPSHKRKATEDIPVASAEDSPDPAPPAAKRASRASKRIKTEAPAAAAAASSSLPKPKPKGKGKGKGKGKARSDPVVIVESSDGEEEKLDFNFEYVGPPQQPLPPPSPAELADTRGRAFAAKMAYEYNKRRPRAPANSTAFIEAVARKRNTSAQIPPPVAAIAPTQQKPKPAGGAVTALTAVDASNILAAPRRTRAPRPEAESSSGGPAAVAGPSSASASQPPRRRKRKDREIPAVVEPAAAEEEPEDAIEYPPMLSRTPSPLPGEEREPGPDPGVEDPDGLYAPSAVTTILGPDGLRYREFVREHPQTGVEELFWVRVR